MSAQLTVVQSAGRSKAPRALLYVFLTLMAALWLVPVGSAVYASLRPYDEGARGVLVAQDVHLPELS
jgi:ABC-type glycerol-3-phosphate transport system permease component